MEVVQLLGSQRPGGTKCGGSPAASGTEAMALLESFSNLWQRTPKGPPRLVLLCCLEQQVLRGLPGWGFLYCFVCQAPKGLADRGSSLLLWHQALKGPPSLGSLSMGQLPVGREKLQ